MSSLVLVRHGQATLFGGDVDLSPVGEEQARRLGAYWVKHDAGFDEVYAGSLKRQVHTAELVGQAMTNAGLPWSEPVVLDELREYQVQGDMRERLAELGEHHPDLTELIQALEASGDKDGRQSSYWNLFERVMRKWVAGTLNLPGIETWMGFQRRVNSTIDRIRSEPKRGRRVVVFTSGGPIGTITQLALRAPGTTALELNWRVRNCSLTQFAFTPDRFSLDSFNTIPHLEDPKLWTYR